MVKGAVRNCLHVLCVLLLQNIGLKLKDVTALSTAIDVLGTVAAMSKHDDVLYKKFWIVQLLLNEDDMDYYPLDDEYSVCLDSRVEKPLVLCEGRVGGKKRMISLKDQAIAKSKKNARRCNYCGEYEIHDSRNCPVKKEDEEDILNTDLKTYHMC
ncbi:hypothetical protein Tco_1131556 [Tanacetum coccineum]